MVPADLAATRRLLMRRRPLSVDDACPGGTIDYSINDVYQSEDFSRRNLAKSCGSHVISMNDSRSPPCVLLTLTEVRERSPRYEYLDFRLLCGYWHRLICQGPPKCVRFRTPVFTRLQGFSHILGSGDQNNHRMRTFAHKNDGMPKLQIFNKLCVTLINGVPVLRDPATDLDIDGTLN